ncbi:ribosome biogenesis GTPase RsgA [Acrasis kona]|uniref:Ribosome biogenesis GTPase RsgA n=1 Tax=Acrasis kona TaxID=1008807 RepID=A0AAW2ZHY0_9EUKA
MLRLSSCAQRVLFNRCTRNQKILYHTHRILQQNVASAEPAGNVVVDQSTIVPEQKDLEVDPEINLETQQLTDKLTEIESKIRDLEMRTIQEIVDNRNFVWSAKCQTNNLKEENIKAFIEDFKSVQKDFSQAVTLNLNDIKLLENKLMDEKSTTILNNVKSSFEGLQLIAQSLQKTLTIEKKKNL